MDSPQDVYALVALGATEWSVGLVVALVVVTLRRPREAGAWWPAAATLVRAVASAIPAALDDGVVGYAIAVELVTVGCATVLAPLEELGGSLGAALIYVTRHAAGIAVLLLTTADVISVAGTLVRSQSSSLFLVIVGLQVLLRFFVIAAARGRPRPVCGWTRTRRRCC